MQQQQRTQNKAAEEQLADGTSSSRWRRGNETSLQKERAQRQLQQQAVQQAGGHKQRVSTGSKAAMGGSLLGRQPLQQQLLHLAALGSCSLG
jgi:hypothetical protein